MTEIEQGSDEWKKIRCGKVTASRISDVLSKGRGKNAPSLTRAGYMAQLIGEQLTGEVEDGYFSADMQWGTDQEPQARLAYEIIKGAEVEQVAFVEHPSIAMTGASPDGLIGDDGLIEIKCPQTKTHIDTLLNDTVPTKYIHQMQWQMACTSRAWCDFVSFDPRLPTNMQMFCKRVLRDDEAIAEIELAVGEFLNELAATIANLNARNTREAA